MMTTTTTTSRLSETDSDDTHSLTLASPPVSSFSLQQQQQQQESTTLYQTGLITIGFCTLAFASLSPISKWVLSGEQEISVLLFNAMTTTLAFFFVSTGGSHLERIFLSNRDNEGPLVNDLHESDSRNNNDAWKGGLELGLWKSLGTTANLYGLSMTTADHGAFLIQLTTLIVPMVQAMCGVPIPRRIQASVGLALMGVFLFTQDSTSSSGMMVMTSDTTDVGAAAFYPILLEQQKWGDLLCIVAAGFYATYDLRLFQWGQRVAPRPLMVRKIFVQAVLAIAFLWASQEPFWNDACCTPTTCALVIWSGCVIHALVPFLQVTGQQMIGPTRSQTIYASQPLWASMMSFCILGETVGLQGLVGGSAFLVALLLAATAAPPENKDVA